MYQHSRLTSESSYATNASGSTVQTDLSGDDVIDNCAKNSNTYKGQTIEYLGNTPAIDSSAVYQRSNLQLPEEIKHDGEYFYIPSNEREARHLYSQRRSIETKRESVPLLVRNERKYAVQDIIRSEDFKKFFESEYAEIVKFRKNNKSLKKLFLTLAVLNIILIICTVSVMPVILVSLRVENSHVMSDKALEEFVIEKLESPRAKEIIRQLVPCDNCKRLSDKLETGGSEIKKVWKSIDKLEDVVIKLQQTVSTNTGNETGKHLQSSFQKTSLHKRVEYNNHLLNKFVNWKRSSMQLIGSLSEGRILWDEDVSNGNMMSRYNNGIHVNSGGTYFLYAKMQFSKSNCTGAETFEYHVIKDTNTPISHVKQHCTVPGGFEQSLHIQKVVRVQLNEKATFYIKLNSVDPSYFSKDIRTHVFGIIEI